MIIHAQEPKLGAAQAGDPREPRPAVAGRRGAVNVKAKTGEHVGPVGRGEAIACEAVVLIEPCRGSSVAPATLELRHRTVQNDETS